MNRAPKAGALILALRTLAPHATVTILQERAWYSLTFVGHQICLAIRIESDGPAIVQWLTDCLPDHEFNLPGQMVADIAVTDISIDAGITQVIVDALLLDD